MAGATPRPVKYATLTGFICFYCYCILGRINPRHFGPRSHQHRHQHLPTCHRARAGAGAGARASAFCAAVSGSCTSFAALICRSLIYLAIHTYIAKYDAGFMICQQKVQSMVEELCSQLKSHRGECVFKRLFNGVSLSLTAYMSITCIFMSQPCKFNAMCHGTSSSTLNILLSVLKFN